MFLSTSPFLVFDHLRVPYQVDASNRRVDGELAQLELLRPSPAAEGGPALHWPALTPGCRLYDAAAPEARLRLGGVTLHGRILPAELLQSWLQAAGGGWAAVADIVDAGGRPVGALWRARDGSVCLPFDPSQLVRTFWSEGYARIAASRPGGRLRAAALTAYYRLRPLLPRAAQIALRRLYSRVQARSEFPAWPMEESLHDFLRLVLEWVAAVAAAPVPMIAPWPAGRSWALVLTHDVETAEGVRRIPVLREVEESSGHRSSWNFVPRRYDVPDAVLADLRRGGCEVGLHGLFHDGRDLESESTLAQRLPEMRSYGQRWGAVGFRSPATQRDWALMSRLPFDHDSSYPDTDPFEPQAGGCCSWLPFFNGPVVELPITLAQDHTLFMILRHRDGRVWIEKAEQLRARGGMALLITHPDYVDLGPVAAEYGRLLAHFRDDPTVWRALPSEISSWWRRRAASSVERGPDGWRVVGPAAGEAVVSVTAPGPIGGPGR